MLTSQLEILEQAQSYLCIISEQHYRTVLTPHFISSPGTHIRHVLDHYSAIMFGLNKGIIDYDGRTRGHEIEQSPALALVKIKQITTWLKTLSITDMQAPILLSTEISVVKQKVETVSSSVARELIFAGSHAVHHYVMIRQMALIQKIVLPKHFGIAPATATFLRQETQQTPVETK